MPSKAVSYCANAVDVVDYRGDISSAGVPNNDPSGRKMVITHVSTGVYTVAFKQNEQNYLGSDATPVSGPYRFSAAYTPPSGGALGFVTFSFVDNSSLAGAPVDTAFSFHVSFARAPYAP